MLDPMTSIETLPKGFRFPSTKVQLTREWVGEYMAAVEDGTTAELLPNSAPPMALLTLAIRSLLENATPPSGALHAGQELEIQRPANVGEEITIDGEVAGKGERQGWILLSIAFAVSDAQGRPLITGRTTLTTPASAGAGKI